VRHAALFEVVSDERRGDEDKPHRDQFLRIVVFH